MNFVRLALIALASSVAMATTAEAQVVVGVGGFGVGPAYYPAPAISVYRAPVAPVVAYHPAVPTYSAGYAPTYSAGYGPSYYAGYGPSVGLSVAGPALVPAPVVVARPIVVRPRYRFGQPVRNVVRSVVW